jgi:RNA polymerase sigma factor (sigma-70 family)
MDARGLESTASLLRSATDGSREARDRLVRRFLAPLRRFAHRRLPPSLRGLAETDDLVQVTLIRALDRVEEFEPRHTGAFLAYLRRILDNHLRDLARQARRRPIEVELDAGRVEGEGSRRPEVDVDTVLRYREALARLPEDDQAAVLLRLEMGFTHDEVAAALGLPSPNAARMRVTRALERLAESMDGR